MRTREARNYILGPFEGSRVLSARSTRNQPDERGRTYVRQPDFQGGDRRVRPDRRDRIAWYLFLGRDGRIALCAVRACFGVLCDVPSRVLLVDGVWAGTRPVGALRPQRVGRFASDDSLSISDTSGLSWESPCPRSLGARNSRVIAPLRVVTS